MSAADAGGLLANIAWLNRLGSAKASGGLHMEFLFEIVVQFLGEIALQMVFEIAAELGLRSLSEPFKMSRNPALSIIGFVLWGAAAGGISLFILPRSPIPNLLLRKINIVVTPLVVGGVMMAIGRRRDRKGAEVGQARPLWSRLHFCLSDGHGSLSWGEMTTLSVAS